MDKTEQNSLNHIPMQSLSLRLARPTIRMQHGSRWRIDKVNPVHDLLICMTGGGDYEIGEIRQPVRMRAGDAMLIPAYTRFAVGTPGVPSRSRASRSTFRWTFSGAVMWSTRCL